MKYCPYCGADLIDSESSFCAECGETLPCSEKKTVSPSDNKRRRKRDPHKAAVVHSKGYASYSEAKPEDEYDGYYDDVIPEDNGVTQQTIDKILIKKVALLIIGLIIVVGACVAIMYLL